MLKQSAFTYFRWKKENSGIASLLSSDLSSIL